MVGRKVLYGLIAQTCLQYLGDLKFCVPETFKFWERFVQPRSGVLVFKMWWIFVTIGYFDTAG